MMSTQSQNEITPEARAYLWSQEVFDGLSTIVQTAGRGEDELTTLHADVIALCEGTMTEKQVIDGIKKTFSLGQMQAMAMLDDIVSGLLIGKIGKEVAPGFSLGEAAEKKTVVEVVKPSGAILKSDDHKQDEKELTAIKEKQASVLASPASLDIPEIVKTICENPVFQFQDPILQDRCRKLVESRVRDVRTPEQTRSQLERSIETGGLGVTGRRLADLLQVLETQVQQYQDSLMIKQEQEKSAVKEARQKKVEEKIDLKKQEADLLSKRYAEITQSVRSAIEQSKVPAKPKRPVVQAQASMQEVAFSKRLVGPVEELKSMTLTDFRRLSKDSRQAATKVKDKVGLLENEGYDKKIEGIKAWRSCALSKMYMELTRDAVLKGVPLMEFLASRRAAKEETLTDEELKVIMELNGELRF